MRRRAFTLVELLVVIGIIALLIGILMPGLIKARESARRANCLANLRSVGQLLGLYANQSKDQIPVGYSVPTGGTGSHLQDFWITRVSSAAPSPGESVRFVGLGLLLPANLMTASDEGRIFYCPSTNEETTFSYNSTENPWKPTGPGPAGWQGTRIGYSSRSCNPASTRPANLRGVAWVADAAAASPTFHAVDEAGNRTEMMRQSKLKDRAILADIVSNSSALELAHVRGVNVLFADGSAKWVPKDTLYGSDARSAEIMDSGLVTGGPLAVLANSIIDKMWERLDVAP